MKQSLLYVLLIFSFSMPGCGQKDKKEQATNQVVNPVIPDKPIGWVSDFEKIFSPAEIASLDSIISEHEVKTTNEIAIVTFPLDTFGIKTPEDFDKFSLSLFQQWGIGKKDKNNGIGILLSIQLRKIRIEVGYGLEAKLTNEEAQEIINTIILPEIKKGKYYTGILSGLKAILEEIK
jgi:uncharacterized protein